MERKGVIDGRSCVLRDQMRAILTDGQIRRQKAGMSPLPSGR